MMIQINASKSAKDVTTNGVEFSQGTFKLKCENSGVSGDAAFEMSEKADSPSNNVFLFQRRWRQHKQTKCFSARSRCALWMTARFSNFELSGVALLRYGRHSSACFCEYAFGHFIKDRTLTSG